jgi:hypothetical protein
MPTADPTWAADVIRGGCGVPGCAEPTCTTRCGECHCGCGGSTTLARQSNRRLNLVKGEPQRFLNGHILRSALEIRWANSDAERRVRERECEREGCVVRFTPTLEQLRRGAGKYCSRQCYWAAAAKYPDPGQRVCARPGCEQTFRRPPAIIAEGKGRYCSRECRCFWRISASQPATAPIASSAGSCRDGSNSPAPLPTTRRV